MKITSWETENKFVRRTLLMFFALNCIVWFLFTKNIRPDLTITPAPPGKHLLKLFSMGDDLFIYRYFGYKIQMAGDDYGTTTPLKDYSYDKLQKWFFLLDEFDGESELIPTLAGLYFSNSQNRKDNTYIVDYLLFFVKRDVNKNWRWATTALYLSDVKLNDQKRVKEATDLILQSDPTKVPLWARALGIFITQEDDICASIDFLTKISEKEMQDILEDKIIAAGGERNPFAPLVVRRLQAIKKNPLAVRKCLMKKSK